MKELFVKLLNKGRATAEKFVKILRNLRAKRIFFILINAIIVIILVIGIRRLLSPPEEITVSPKKAKKKISKPKQDKEVALEKELPIPFMPERREVFPVKVYRVSTLREFTDELPVVGTIKSIPELELKFEINGVIKEFRFREGDEVRKGEVIAFLDSKDIEKELAWAKAKLEVAKAELRAAQARYKVLKNLYEAGAIIKDRLAQAEADIEVAKSRVEVSEKEVGIAKAKLEKTKLIAPRRGILGKREKEPGEFVTPNDIVAILFDPENIFVEVGIIEKDIWKIKTGQKATVYVDTYPNRRFYSYIEKVFPQVEERTRTMTVRLRVLDPAGLLKPGMFARAEITIYRKANAIVVPTGTIRRERGRYFIPVVENDAVQYRPIRDEYRSIDYVVIRSGIEPGDLVIVETPGMRKLNPGDKVKIIEIQESLFK